MNRLTNSTESIIKAFATPIDVHKKQLIYLKLKDLEDLEEEIGMSLLSLFRIIKHGQLICKFRPIYDRKKTILVSRKINSLYYDGCYYKLEIDEDGDEGYIINYDPYIKDYGITWALTREELEND